MFKLRKPPGWIPDPKRLHKAALARMKTGYQGRHLHASSMGESAWSAAITVPWYQRLASVLNAALNSILRNVTDLATNLAKLRASKPARRPVLAAEPLAEIGTVTGLNRVLRAPVARHRAPRRRLLATLHRGARASVPSRLPRRLQSALDRTLARGGQITRRHVHPDYRKGARALPVWIGA